MSVCTYRTFLGVIATAFLIGIPAGAFAGPSSQAEVYDRANPAEVSYEVRQIQGESIDPRSLAVSWEVRDLVIPGPAGFDLEIIRSHRGVRNTPKHMGDWTLDVPRIQIGISPYRTNVDSAQPGVNKFAALLANLDVRVPTGSEGVCDVAGGLVENVLLNNPSNTYFYAYYSSAPITLLVPGQGAKILLSKKSSATQFPANVDYVTADNWTVECLGSNNSFSNWGGFRVRSPNGIVYTIDRMAYMIPGEPNYGYISGSLELQATSVQDRHGNAITYKYDDYDSSTQTCPVTCSQLLYEIEANDGRKVFIDYMAGSNGFESMRDEYFALVTKLRYVTDIATSAEEEIVYSYCADGTGYGGVSCNSNIVLDTAQDGNLVDNFPYLNSVTLADGRKWKYTLSGKGEVQLINPGAFGFGYSVRYLGTVTLPSGGVVTYEYDPNNLYNGYAPAAQAPFPRLSKRTISGPNVTTGVWDYTYANSGNIESTTVTGPDKLVKYRFLEGWGSWVFYWTLAARNGNSYSYPSGADEFGMGKPLDTELWSADGLTRLRTTDYAYSVLPLTGEYYYRCASTHPVCSGANAQNLMDFGQVTLVSSQAGVVREATVTTTDHLAHVDKDYVVSTPLADFDDFGFPDTRTETGWDGKNGDAISRTIAYTYFHSTTPWVVGQLDTVTLNGKVINRDYFAANAMLEELDTYGVVENYTYYSSGDLHRRRWVRDGIQHENRYSGYKLGVPLWDVTEVDPSNTALDISIKREVDDIGRLKYIRDGELDYTYYGWDEGRRLTTIDHPSQDDVTFAYVIDGTSGFWDETTVVQGAYKRTIELDGFGRKRHDREEDTFFYASDAPRAKTFQYDGAGRLEWETAYYDWTSPSAFTSAPRIVYSYDEFDRVTQVVNVNGTDTTTTCYGQSCNTGEYATFDPTLLNGYVVTDEGGYQTGYEYRAFGHPDNRELTRVVQQIEKASQGGPTFVVTRINRNGFGDITRVRQGDGSSADLTRDYEYNSKLQLWKVTNPETGVTEFTYDEVGNRKTVKVGSSAVTTYNYDGANRLVGIVYPDDTPADPNDPKLAPDVMFEYYKDDLVKSAGHDSIRWLYEYTPEGLVTVEQLDVDTLSYFLQNTYDIHGGLKSVIYPAGNEITFFPDALGRPRQVKDAAIATSYVSNVQYWPDNTVKSMDMGNGTTYTGTRTARLYPDVLKVAKGGVNLVRLDYNTNARGNITSITDTVNANNNRTMTYDGLSRLITANGHWGTGTVDYDRVGNITQKTMGSGGAMNYTVNPSTNLLTGVSGPAARSYTYDVYGNVTGDGTFTFKYNSASELTSVPAGLPAGVSLNYRYDANSKRTVEKRGSDTSYHGYNQAGKLMFSLTCTADEAEQFYYLGNKLVARETTQCLQGCHPAQQ